MGSVDDLVGTRRRRAVKRRRWAKTRSSSKGFVYVGIVVRCYCEQLTLCCRTLAVDKYFLADVSNTSRRLAAYRSSSNFMM